HRRQRQLALQRRQRQGPVSGPGRDYSVDNAKVQYLGQGETRTEVFTVYSQDGTAHDITVVVTGVNDTAVISG
ncbi:VCBS domain-containing protein, partial [Chromobacterium piscinae]